MKNMILISLSLLFFSCTKQATQFELDPELAPYYEDFVQSGQIRGQDVSTDDLIIKFGNTKDERGALAYCGRDFTQKGEVFLGGRTEYNTPKVVVDREYFKILTAKEKRAVLFHELGHCLLNREHSSEITPYQFLKSIMYPYLITRIIGYYYDAMEENYIDELFNPNTPAINPDIAWAKYVGRYQEQTPSSPITEPPPPIPVVSKMTIPTEVTVHVMGLDGKCNHTVESVESLKNLEVKEDLAENQR